MEPIFSKHTLRHKVSWYLWTFTVMTMKVAVFWHGMSFRTYPEDGSSRYLRNDCNDLSVYLHSDTAHNRTARAEEGSVSPCCSVRECVFICMAQHSVCCWVSSVDGGSLKWKVYDSNSIEDVTKMDKDHDAPFLLLYWTAADHSGRSV
jgi:hypothetical protein